MNSEKQYIDIYENCREMICKHSAEVMNSRRDAAFDAFRAQGFPTKKLEDYRYTDIGELFAPDYGLNINRLNIPVNPYDAFKCDVPNLSTQLYFVVNDAFYDKVLPKTELPEGVIVDSLKKVAEQNPELVDKYYARLSDNGSLNTVLAQDGLFVYVPKGVRIDKTIQVINILRSDVDLMINRRVLVVAEECSEVKILFCDHAVDDRRFLTTQEIEVFAGENANVEIYGLEETHVKSTLVSNTNIEMQRNAHVNHNLVTLHNGTTRQFTRLFFRGEGAECSLNGCVIADKQQHVDNNVQILHAVPHCDSHVTYKYVLDEQATGAFAGLVKVEQGAQKTTSEMANQNLCATKEARMFTQPQLEIYADDVKCSHGSTVGQLNDKALFYMQQRGISLKEARMLLQNAFVGEVIDRIPLEPLRDRLHYLVEKRFRGELSKCEGCKLCK